eukprot:Awhi_evm1s13774
MAYQQQYPPAQQCPPAAPAEEGEEGSRGLSKNQKIGVGIAAAAAVAGAGYMVYKKKKRVKMADGSFRDIDCDPNDPEGFFVDENGQPTGDRGVGGSMKNLAHNKNAQIAAGVLAVGAVAAGGYMVYRKKKKVSQRQVMPDGSTRDVLVEVDCDPNDPEGYEVDENGQPRGIGGSMSKVAHNKNAQIAAGVLAAGAVAAGGYYMYNKKKKKKVAQRQVMPDGSTRDVMIEVDCDPNDPQGYFVEENGQPCQQQQQPMQQQQQQPPMQGSPYGSQQQFGSPYGSQAQLPVQGSPYGSPQLQHQQQPQQQQAPNPYAGMPPVGSNPALPPMMFNASTAAPPGFNPQY